MKFYHITLLLLPILLLTIGCSVDTVEESDADILDPTATDFRFQNLPIIDGAGGSLIPLDEIPVVTIEKTREDDEFIYWQLKADPAPIHEDLVVGVAIQVSRFDEEVFTELSPVRYFDGFSGGIIGEDGDLWVDYDFLYVVVIPRFQNTSQEFYLPFLRFRNFPTLHVVGASKTVNTIIEVNHFSPNRTRDSEDRDFAASIFAALDVPMLITSDDYIIREGFRFSYYVIGEEGSLKIEAQDQ